MFVLSMNLNTKIMKRIKQCILSVSIILIGLTAAAQSHDLNNLYYSYKGEDGVVAMRIPGFVMRLASSIADLEREEKQLLRSMRSVQLIVIENSELNSEVNFVDDVDLHNLSNGYNLLLQVKDGQDDVAILAREKRGCIKDLVVLVGGEENVMVHIKGRMDSDLLGSLANVAGIEELKYTKKI